MLPRMTVVASVVALVSCSDSTPEDESRDKQLAKIQYEANQGRSGEKLSLEDQAFFIAEVRKHRALLAESLSVSEKDVRKQLRACWLDGSVQAAVSARAQCPSISRCLEDRSTEVLSLIDDCITKKLKP